MLERYDKVLNCKIDPYYLEAKKVELKSDENLDCMNLDELWRLHNRYIFQGVPPFELKRKIAHEILKDCKLCERRCSVDRTEEQRGYCGVLESNVSSEFLHLGEENVLVPSHTVFFSRCNFGCVFCQNWEISQKGQGRYIEPEILASRLERSSGKNVNWVGGDPTPNIPYIMDVLSYLSKPIPQVWNSNMYLSMDSMRLLAKLMDLYLTDFKYGDDRCAERLSDVKNYTKIVKRNHKIAEKTGDLIIRHLVLPGHLECCTKPILEWIDGNLKDPMVNIMTQYRPCYQAGEYSDIDRYLDRREKMMIRELKRKYSHLTP